MATDITALPAVEASGARTAARIGFPLALLMAALAAVGFLVAILTPPRSGPFCTGGCIAYPYADAVRFFPRDYYWMLPGVTLAPLVLTMAACLHFSIPARRRLFSLLAVCFATIATAFITLDYFVQVLMVQPGMVHGESDGIALLTQYNPHGLFIMLEDLGYLLLAKTFVLLAMALPSARREAWSLRLTFGIAGGLALVSFVLMAVRFGVEMALPFELAVITVVWIGLIPMGILLSRYFKRLVS